MGSELTTEELRRWAASRGLSGADAAQIIAVGEARDAYRAALSEFRAAERGTFMYPGDGAATMMMAARHKAAVLLEDP